MKTRHRRHPILFLFLLLFAIGSLSEQAHAKRGGFKLITVGDTIKDLGAVPAEEGAPAGVHVGFKYGYFGLFWIDLWTWSGEYCLFTGGTGAFDSKKFQPIAKEEAERILGKKVSKPLLYTFPPLLVLIVLVAAFKIWRVMAARKQPAPGFRSFGNSPSDLPNISPPSLSPPSMPQNPPDGPTPPPMPPSA